MNFSTAKVLVFFIFFIVNYAFQFSIPSHDSLLEGAKKLNPKMPGVTGLVTHHVVKNIPNAGAAIGAVVGGVVGESATSGAMNGAKNGHFVGGIIQSGLKDIFDATLEKEKTPEEKLAK